MCYMWFAHDCALTTSACVLESDCGNLELCFSMGMLLLLLLLFLLSLLLLFSSFPGVPDMDCDNLKLCFSVGSLLLLFSSFPGGGGGGGGADMAWNFQQNWHACWRQFTVQWGDYDNLELCFSIGLLLSLLSLSEPGICCGNEDSRGNENRKSRGKNICCGKKIDKHTLFYEN